MSAKAITAAVKKLRIALGDTQQQFAQRMGWAISTVVRYESTRAPKGKVLGALVRLARDQGQEKLASVFAQQLGRELGFQIGEMKYGDDKE